MLVDGARRPSTVLLLSHWPGADAPDRLRRDTSTEMALAHLDDPERLPGGTGLVAVDHLDEDGLAALFALCRPDDAVAHAAVLVALARAGDFDVVEPGGPGDGARAAWALRRLLDPQRTPLGALAGPGRPTVDAPLLDALLGYLGELLASPGRAAALAAEEATAVEAAAAALAAGAAVVEERPAVDLAVVTVDGAPPRAAGLLGHGAGRLPLHPAALHAATPASRVLVVAAGGYTYYDRYETWVRYVSRPLPARRDLVPLAARLAALEGAAGSWRATPPSSLVPVLATAPGHASRLAPAVVVEAIAGHLASAPPAWPPVAAPRPGGPAGPGGTDRPRRSAGPRGGTTGQAPARWRGRSRRRPSA